MPDLAAPTLAEILAARQRVEGTALRTQLVRLPTPNGGREIWLKLETLQPIGSFKIRGAASAIKLAPREQLARGVFTASAGNMAQGVAWCARELGVPCTVVVPDSAPRAKLEAVEALGGRLVAVSFDRWWQVLVERRFEGLEGLFVHPVSDAAVIAGNATIGLEILEDLPAVTDVFVPFGGGGLSCGIAAALRVSGAGGRVIAAEVETAAPLAASLRAGRASRVERRPSFVDGIGGGAVLEEMWPLAASLLAGTCIVTLDEIAAAIRMLVRQVRVVAEGAGGASLAAALSGRAAVVAGGAEVERGGWFIGATSSGPPASSSAAEVKPFGAGPLVCVISGGGIDPSMLSVLLRGELPQPPC
ncbi:MAG: pyridoxal-phosphate dependent enzyme [Candidatus Eisenbacteria bacterium]